MIFIKASNIQQGTFTPTINLAELHLFSVSHKSTKNNCSLSGSFCTQVLVIWSPNVVHYGQYKKEKNYSNIL